MCVPADEVIPLLSTLPDPARIPRSLLHSHSHEDQARVLMLYILCAKAVEPAVRNELLALSRVTPREQTALLNLINLHVPTTRKVGAPAAGRGALVARRALRACLVSSLPPLPPARRTHARAVDVLLLF